MKKLNTTFKINPLYESDGYKLGHKSMLAPNTQYEYFTWIPRSLKYMPEGINKIMSGGQQLVVRYIHSTFKEFFFDKDINVALNFVEDMSKYLGMQFDGQHFSELHQLGYLPIKFQSLEEGIFTPANIPHLTGINTKPGYAWLGLYLETMISKLAWQLPTAATLSYQFNKNAKEWAEKTNKKDLFLVDYMSHDFHSRGGNPFSSIAIGLGHAFCNLGSDTLNVIPAARYYYDVLDNDVCISSVNASEHSVTCTGIFYYEKRLKAGLMQEEIKQYYSFDAPCDGTVENPDYLAIAEWLNLKRWLKMFPNGILSVVSDTFDLWKLITYILPRLKNEILNRDGKLVIRPDSGDPVDITCGLEIFKHRGVPSIERKVSHFPGLETIPVSDSRINKNELKGVIELLWDIFGGTISEEGYKVLDPHIGAIYGDSINLERQVAIYSRLADKGFAATNIVVGIGSYTYIYQTRDSLGFAAKGAWFSTIDDGIESEYVIYKDPITDDGTKKSLKGFQLVYKDENNNIITERTTKEICYSTQNMLQTVYEDGVFYNQTNLYAIRNRIKENS